MLRHEYLEPPARKRPKSAIDLLTVAAEYVAADEKQSERQRQRW